MAEPVKAKDQASVKSVKTTSVRKKKKKKRPEREKLTNGEYIKSEEFGWEVNGLLGSGGFGDVYKVKKLPLNDLETYFKTREEMKDSEKAKERCYAMKTEHIVGDKRLLRLKIELMVMMKTRDVQKPERKCHFIEFVDRGITDQFKFVVMGMVGPSLEDIRRNYLLTNYRDVKPANYAVGLHEDGKETLIYIFDFGIARKYTAADNKTIKVPRVYVKFLGTLRFASRACHYGVEQGRKDDLETWLYMIFDLFDDKKGLPWKKISDKKSVLKLKEQFFAFQRLDCYRIVPADFAQIVNYVNALTYADEPDYFYLQKAMKYIAKDEKISLDDKLDWVDKLHSKPEQPDKKPGKQSGSTDNKQSGTLSAERSKKKHK